MDGEAWERTMAQLILATQDQELIQIRVGEKALTVEVASTPTTRLAGLANRTEMPEDGMLFAYETDSGKAYHRTTMQFPITIRFYDAAGELVWEDDDSQIVRPGVIYRYVLETRQGLELEGRLTLPN
jgi:uncharacterized membrane protein (UPF0127 family)